MASFINPVNNRKVSHPVTKEEAINIRDPWYTDAGNQCPNCGTNSPYRYVSDDTCYHCLNDQRKASAKLVDYSKFEFPGRLCRTGTHWVVVRRGTRRCAICEGVSSPRQKAIRDGEKYYTPDHPCKHCKTLSPKQVNNGRCSGCQPPRETDLRRVDHDAIIPPGTVISRDTAIQTGLKHYRTGKPCKHGHDTLRHVSTRQCVKCR